MECRFCNLDFRSVTIYEGEYWRVVLNSNQYYLGRVIIVLKRHLEDPLELSRDELNELIELSRKTVMVLKKLFQPDLINYAMLGNIIRHVHLHVIPRYKSERFFGGVRFIDENWGKHYYPYPEFEIPLEIMHKMIVEMRDAWKMA